MYEPTLGRFLSRDPLPQTRVVQARGDLTQCIRDANLLTRGIERERCSTS